MAGNYLYYPEERKWCLNNIYSLKNYLNKDLRSGVSQNINYKIIRLSLYLGRYSVRSQYTLYLQKSLIL